MKSIKYKNILLVFSIVIFVSGGGIYYFYKDNIAIHYLRKAHETFLKNHPFSKTTLLTAEERKAQELPPNPYFEREYLLEMSPQLGRPTPEKLFELQEQLNQQNTSYRVSGDMSDNPWIERGPNNVGGRTRAILFDPNDVSHNRVFAGGVSGGLWVNDNITDANSSWQRLDIPENLAVSCIVVDPNNSNIFYLGTGESYTGGGVNGNGVWKSIDGGATWSHIFGGSTGPSTTTTQTLIPGFFHINDILAWDNAGNTEVFLGVGSAFFSDAGSSIPSFLGAFETGLYKSTNGGATFNQITLNAPNGEPYEPNDFEVSADNTIWMSSINNIFGGDGGGGGRIFYSVDGNAFILKHIVNKGDRTEIEVSATNPNKLYALSQIRRTLASDPFLDFISTTNAFTNTTNLALPNDADNGIPANDFTRGQSFYDLVIEADPANDAIIYAGGIDVFRSTNSGSSWTQISKWSNNPNLNTLSVPIVHADQHALVFHPTNSDIAVLGTDGGIYYASSLSAASSSSTAISSRNKDYNVTQFYKGAIGQSTSDELLLGGTQDNGSPFMNGASPGVNPSIDIFGGDGAYEFIDKDGDYMIVSYVFNSYARLDLPYTGSGISIIQDQTTGDFINPAELDDNLEVLYTNGTNATTNRISRYTGIVGAGPVVRTNIVDALLTGSPTAFKVSPFTTTSTTLIVGTENGRLLHLANANTSPVFTDITDASFVGSISNIEFGATEMDLLVSFHNYDVVNVWYTNDGGTTWFNKEGNLPDLPVKAILMNPTNNNEVILGTDLGVWRTNTFFTANPVWMQSQNGMQNSKVTSFDLRTADNTILASTYGRGLFTGQFTATTFISWTGAVDTDWFTTGNWDSNIIPTSSDLVYIPGGLPNYPLIIGGTATCCQIKVEAETEAFISIDVNNSGSLQTNNGDCFGF